MYFAYAHMPPSGTLNHKDAKALVCAITSGDHGIGVVSLQIKLLLVNAKKY